MAGQRTRTAGALLAWLLAAAVATLVGAVAVGAIGSGIVPSGQQPLTQAEVDARLAEPTPSTPPSSSAPSSSAPRSSSAKPSTPKPKSKTFSGQGGTVIAQCAGSRPVVKQTVPDLGFEVDVDAEDGGQRVRFENDDETVRIERLITCRGGTPVSVTRTDNSGPGDDDDD